MRRDMLWDHILTNKKGLIRDVKVRGSLDCSDHEMVELRVMRAGRKAQSRSQPQASGKQTLACYRTCLEGSHGRQTWREEWSRRAG